MEQLYGISRNHQTPYTTTPYYQQAVQVLAANMRANPGVHYAIVTECDGCGVWFDLAEGVDGYHSLACQVEAEESWRADSLEDIK